MSTRRFVLQEGQSRGGARRHGRRHAPGRGRGPDRPPRRWARRVGFAALTIVIAAVLLLGLLAHKASGPGALGPAGRVTHANAGATSASDRGNAGAATAALVTPAPAPARVAPPKTDYAIRPAPAGEQIRPKLKFGLRSGVLFDVRTGRVLWERDPLRRLPIASLTKMMTALVVTAKAKPSAKVLITRQAVHFSGSGVGMLPLGKRVPLGALLYGLLLPSGNDAAIALAQHVGRTQTRFVS